MRPVRFALLLTLILLAVPAAALAAPSKPTITIKTPTATKYNQNSSVLANYSCTNATTCTAKVGSTAIATGQAIPTGTVGSFTFTVTAVHTVGTQSTTATKSVNYSVVAPASKPVNTVLPSISGTPQVDQVLAANPGTWTGTTPITYTYKWSDGTNGQSNTLSPGSYYLGKSLTVTVTAKNSAGSTTATSPPVGPITSATDTVSPSQPGTPKTNVISSSEIDLSWAASTDNVGVSGYQVERCQGSGCSNFAQIATPTGPSYKDMGLTASTSYTYRVRATDAGDNVSAYSNPATAATSAATQPGDCSNGYVGITFDDGPTSMSQQYINALNDGGAHATFFLLGEQMQSYPNAAAAELADGNDIGDHTWDHSSFTGHSTGGSALTDAQITSEIQQQAGLAQSQTGYMEKLFRPPYGDMNQHTFDLVNSLGFTSVMWTADTEDWSSPPTSQIVSTFLDNARDQAVILQHDGYPNTLAAIPQELAGLKAKGLCPGKIVPDPTNSDNQVDYNGLPMNWKVVAWPSS